MSQYDLRSTYDGALTYQVTAPGNGSSYASLWSLLTAAQQAQLTNGITCCRVDLSPVLGVNYQTAPPGSAIPGSNTPGTLDGNSQPQIIVASQKPNEQYVANRPELNVFLRAVGGTATLVSCTFYFVRNEGM